MFVPKSVKRKKKEIGYCGSFEQKNEPLGLTICYAAAAIQARKLRYKLIELRISEGDSVD